MNELDKLVYALEELDLNDRNYHVYTNKGDTRGPQGTFKTPKEEESTVDEPVRRSSFLPRSKKWKDYNSQYHINSKAKFMPNRLLIGDAGAAQFLDLDCKREPKEFLDLWAKNLELFFILGKRNNYSREEKYLIATNTFTGKVDNWFRKVSVETEKVFRTEVIADFEKSTREGTNHLVRYIGAEFLGSQSDISKEKRETRATSS